MFDGLFPQTSHDFLYNKRLLGFLLLIPIGVRAIFFARGAVNHLPKKFSQVAQIFTKPQKRNEGHTMQQRRPYWHMKVDRYCNSFSGSIPANFENNYVAIDKHLEKLLPQFYQIKMKICHEQGLMTSELSQQRNDAIVYFTYSNISWHRELFLKNRSLELFSPIVASMLVKLKWNL